MIVCCTTSCKIDALYSIIEVLDFAIKRNELQTILAVYLQADFSSFLGSRGTFHFNGNAMSTSCFKKAIHSSRKMQALVKKRQRKVSDELCTNGSTSISTVLSRSGRNENLSDSAVHQHYSIEYILQFPADDTSDPISNFRRLHLPFPPKMTSIKHLLQIGPSTRQNQFHP